MSLKLDFEDRKELEAYCKTHAARIQTTNGYTCRVLGGIDIFTNSEDESLAPNICKDGFWESWITLSMLRMLKEGWTCLDIGANHGYYSAIMAVKTSGVVYAFEPLGKYCDLMGKTFKQNKIENVKIIKAATTNTVGEATIWIPVNHEASSSLLRKDFPVPVNTETIETIPVDLLLLSKVDFAKIDAEQAEFLTLRGMEDTIKRSPDIQIICEMTITDESPEFLDYLEFKGFKVGIVDYDGNTKRAENKEILEAENNWVTLYLHK